MKTDKSKNTEKNIKGKREERDIYISAVIISFNEDQNINNAIKSISWANEIIVVDSGSSDRTIHLAKKAGANVYHRKWEGYVNQKNWANSKASGEWILSIDADELVSPELRDEILKTIHSDNTLDGYFIPRRAWFLGRFIRYCHWYPDYQLRLFKKKKGKWEGGRVHERVQVNGDVGYLKNDLLHYTYKDITDQTERLNRYSTLWAEDAYNRGRRTSWLSLLFSPVSTFFNVYFLRLGILDGFAGLVISRSLAYYSFLKKAKLLRLCKEKKNEKSR